MYRNGRTAAAFGGIESSSGEAFKWLSRTFVRGSPVLVARAPGRLDVMGGIADYSGSLVLQLPLACRTWVVLQPRRDRRIEIATTRGERFDAFSTSLEKLLIGPLADPEGLAARLDPSDRWAAYILGVIQLCARYADVSARSKRGLSMIVDSDVPEGEGVASSAALEVATMMVVAAHFGLDLDELAVAAACQLVENEVVGAPCGIMDQMTSLVGQEDRLLRLRCQPAIVEGHLPIPPGYRFYGISSRVRHAVAGNDYVRVRTAAFMGYRLIADAIAAGTGPDGRARPDASRLDGYLCRLTPATFASEFESLLPETMRGADFLALPGGHVDIATSVLPEVDYPVRQATRHPILENARVERFAVLFEGLSEQPGSSEELGELMYASHASYGACGLGSDATDRLVEMVRSAGPECGLFGAKITGGGCGGTVAVFGRDDAEPLVREIADAYHPGARVFARSGGGAVVPGVVLVE